VILAVGVGREVRAQSAPCCDPNSGNCLVITTTLCQQIGGTAAATCTPNTCPQIGRCCLGDGSCTTVRQSACDAGAGGVWTSQAACFTIPCGTDVGVACCYSTTCLLTASVTACLSSSGTVLTTGGQPVPVCSPSICQLGSCCTQQGQCTTVTE